MDFEVGSNEAGSTAEARRDAIEIFLDNPERALELYPQLRDDLIIFFSQSTNPHLHDTNGLPISGREEEYAKWEAARQWSLTSKA